jgi:hypothetical protein
VRTYKPFYQSRPAKLLLVSALGIGLLAIGLPYSPVALVRPGAFAIPYPVADAGNQSGVHGVGRVCETGFLSASTLVVSTRLRQVQRVNGGGRIHSLKNPFAIRISTLFEQRGH